MAKGSRLDSSILPAVVSYLYALRRQSGLTLEELGGRADLARGQISRIENGHESPRRDVLERLARGMGKTLGGILAEVELQRELDEGASKLERLRKFPEIYQKALALLDAMLAQIDPSPGGPEEEPPTPPRLRRVRPASSSKLRLRLVK